MEAIIERYRKDPESVYHTWFINGEDRLKAFRTIRTSLRIVIEEMEGGAFGNDFKGSSLEAVVTSISEQKQLFVGVAHAFFWKPKLRIPDIYENPANQKAFGRFLKATLEATRQEQVIREILALDAKRIKGLGPAVANILYFLHPMHFPPFNTAIVNGYNLLFRRKLKLGSWSAYLDMREHLLEINNRYRNHLSKDLGSLAGLLFEIGSNRLVLEQNAEEVLLAVNDKQSKARFKRHKEVEEDGKEEQAHSEMQWRLARLGQELGYRVWVARNDHKREWNGERLGEYSLGDLSLPGFPSSVLHTVSLIDILWLDSSGTIISGFEVEKSTSIYSGILRLNDLSLTLQEGTPLYLVAPDRREKEIVAQLLRPSFREMPAEAISYILFEDLRCNCEAMGRFGRDASVLRKIGKNIDRQRLS